MNEDELMLEGGEQEQPMDDMTPDEAAASLAFATKLSEGMMPQDPNADMEAEEEATETTGSNLEAKISVMIDQKLRAFKEELLSDLEDEENQTEQVNS